MRFKGVIFTVLIISILVTAAQAKDNNTVNLKALKPQTSVQKMVHLKQEQIILDRLKAKAKAKHFGDYYNATSNQLKGSGGLQTVSCPAHTPSFANNTHKHRANINTSHKQAKPKEIPAFKYSRIANFPPPPEPMPRIRRTRKKPLISLPDVFVKPEVIEKIKVSNRDVNRIVSPFPIQGIVYSKEKGVMVSYMGRNAFLKFAIKKLPYGGYEYISVPTELYIITQNGVYTIVAQPTDIMGRTIRLTGGTLNKIKQNQAMFSQLPYEKRLVKIIKAVYMDKIPSSWEVLHPAVKPVKIGYVNARLIELVNIVGTGFSLKEYEITAKIPAYITEKDFISTKLSRKPVAIALTQFNISPGNPSYLFIVERKGGGKNE